MLHRHIQRMYVPGGIYFVTTDARHHIPSFAHAEIARIVEHSIWHERTAHFVVYAYVVMPDHLHMLFQPTVGNISGIMKSIKENASRDINTYLHSGDGTVAAMLKGEAFRWQKGFYDHVIRDDRDLRNHIEYIRYNPVKAGLVERPEEYPFLFVDDEAVNRVLGL